METEANMGGGEVLLRLIEKATTSTDREVDPHLLKAIKSAVRSSDDEVRVAVDALMDNMKKQHSQVRYLGILIVDELFMRSKLFRTLLVANFDQFLSLSVGFRKNMPLPPPSSVAAVLRSRSIELLEKWNAKFGTHYRQLRLGFDYLKNTLKFEFPNRLENEARLQQERREREIRSKEILLSKFENIKESYSFVKSEIHSTLDQLTECLEIIRLEEDDFVNRNFEMDTESEYMDFKSSNLRQIRLDSLKEGEKVHENNDNKAVFDTIRELYKLLSKHLQSVREYISILVRVDLPDNRFRDSALKDFIDTRNLIHAAKKNCEESGFIATNTKQQQDEADLWEDGKIERCEHKTSTELNKLSDNCSGSDKSFDDPAYIQKTSKSKGKALCEETMPSHKDPTDSTSLRSQLLSEAPVMTWGSFLDNWGLDRDALANHRGLEVENHWGRVDNDAVIPADKIAELNVQVTTYKEPAIEIQPCLAPLKTGGLCQRRDLKICPFHGPIVPRNALRNPLDQRLSSGANIVAESSEGTAISRQTASISGSGDGLILQLAKHAIKNVRTRENEVKASKRAKIAKVRQHNEAVLQEAVMASTSYSVPNEDAATYSSHLEARFRKPTLASMLRKKITTKDRLAQRLLNTHVTEAAIKQLTQGEDAIYKDAFPNQW